MVSAGLKKSKPEKPNPVAMFDLFTPLNEFVHTDHSWMALIIDPRRILEVDTRQSTAVLFGSPDLFMAK